MVWFWTEDIAESGLNHGSIYCTFPLDHFVKSLYTGANRKLTIQPRYFGEPLHLCRHDEPLQCSLCFVCLFWGRLLRI